MQEHNLFIRRFEGEISIRDVLSSLQMQCRDDRIRPDVLGLEDVRGMNVKSWIDYDLETLRRITHEIRCFLERFRSARTAVLVTKTVQLGITRQTSLLADHAGLNVRPFKTLHEAKTFLHLPESLELPLVQPSEQDLDLTS